DEGPAGRLTEGNRVRQTVHSVRKGRLLVLGHQTFAPLSGDGAHWQAGVDQRGQPLLDANRGRVVGRSADAAHPGRRFGQAVQAVRVRRGRAIEDRDLRVHGREVVDVVPVLGEVVAVVDLLGFDEGQQQGQTGHARQGGEPWRTGAGRQLL